MITKRDNFTVPRVIKMGGEYILMSSMPKRGGKSFMCKKLEKAMLEDYKDKCQFLTFLDKLEKVL